MSKSMWYYLTHVSCNYCILWVYQAAVWKCLAHHRHYDGNLFKFRFIKTTNGSEVAKNIQ